MTNARSIRSGEENPDRETSLREAIAAFESGRARNLLLHGAQLRLEDTYLDELCRQAAFSPKDQNAFLYLARVRSQGLQAARQRQFSIADDLFREARQLARQLQVSAACRSVSTAFQTAAEAYTCYALDRFDEARELIYEAMQLDAELEREQGYYLLHLHRIQLVHNLVRIDARRGCSEEALLVCWQTLAYLQGHQQVLPGPAPWDVRTISFISCELVSAMFHQVVAEMAGILTDEAIDRGSEFVPAAAKYLAATAGSRACQFRAGRNWIHVKESFFTNQPLFLQQCCAFLRGERSSHPTLWLATALDLAVVCKEIDRTRFAMLALDLSLEPLPAKLQKAFTRLTNGFAP